MINELHMDSIQPPTIERDKYNHQLVNEIFDRLLKFGTEPDRSIFCQRLQTIWEEQGIFCQSYPTITNQILDLYKLYHLVQEKKGYLEITTNRGWKEISNVLGFGDSGSAAYSVKRNYFRLGLLAYECRFDRAGIDPRSVIELSEMPHTVKKRKRGNNINPSTTRALVKANKQQLQLLTLQHEHDETKSTMTSSIDIHKYPTDYQDVFRLIPQQMSVNDLQQFAYILRAGYLADSNRYLDTILVWLSDQRTASYFNLKYLPGLFNAIIEQYIACLYELFGQSFLQPSSTNDGYIHWLSKFRINDVAIGPHSNQQYLESLFFGTYRYVLKQTINSNDDKQHTDRYYSILTRCSCLTTIIRNLSFIEENEFLAHDRCLLDILERILNIHHQEMHQIYDYDTPFDSANDFIQIITERKINDPFSYGNDCDRRNLMYLLDNTFITLANLSTFIEFRHWYPEIRSRIINTITHWIICSMSFANEPFISMIMEDKLPKEQIFISPRQISLQIFAKFCTNELNVDFILLDLNLNELKLLNHTLLSLMNSSNQEDINREYCLMIICSLCKRNRQLVEFFCSQMIFIELIFNYLEFYEYNQQQYLIATLTSCCNTTSTIPINIPMNHSSDMMIDSCIQLLLLFASIKENNCLKLFEYRLVDMSSSIYFEQRILKIFAEILFIMKS